MRAVLQTMAPVIETSAWRMFDAVETQDRIFVEGVDEFWTKSGRHIVIPYAGVFVFRGKLVSEWREYFDGRISSEMKDGAPITDELKEMISRPSI
jgi:limonene-1,2-epoxide hydrolase